MLKEIKRTVKKTVTNPRETELTRLLTGDNKLSENPVMLQLYLSLATHYESDLQENIFLTSFELDSKYNTMDVNLWNEFKTYPSVRNYSEKFIQEIQMAEAQKHVARSGVSKVTDAIKVQEIIEGKREADKNTDVIVFLIPQRSYMVEE